jgi:sensor histidine kinase YesM
VQAGKAFTPKFARMNDLQTKLPFRPWPLMAWSAFIYLVVIKLRNILLANAPVDWIDRYDNIYEIVLQISVYFSFFSYAFFAYLLLYYLYPQVKKSWWSLILPFSIMVMGCMFFRAFIEEFVLFNIFGQHNYNPQMSWLKYLLDNFYYAIVFTPIGIVYYLSELNRFNEQIRQKADLLHRETELKLLRSQVNPHFLFNTLNNLYSLVATGSDKALPALDKLSGLLRYSLYDQEPLVPLSREVNYLNDFLHLEGLRVENLVPPEVTIGPFSNDWQLPPLLLVPFIENAFKHGELKDPSHPLRVSLTESGNQLHFQVKNLKRKNTVSQDEVGGIGLANTRKRLSLVYPERHELRITEDKEEFRVELRILPIKG